MVYGQVWNGNAEHGNDLDTPFHTPLTALYGGTVVDASYQPWGGQVGILTNVPGLGKVVEYIQHLDTINSNITVGSQVQSGQLLGLSGGENVSQVQAGLYPGSQHPSQDQYSSGPHTEFGFDAPWIAGVQPGMIAYPNPAANSQGSINLARLGQLVAGIGGGTTVAGPSSPTLGISDVIPQSVSQFFTDLSNPQLWIRVAFVIVGALIIILGLVKVVS